MVKRDEFANESKEVVKQIFKREPVVIEKKGKVIRYMELLLLSIYNELALQGPWIYKPEIQREYAIEEELKVLKVFLAIKVVGEVFEVKEIGR